MGLPVDPADLYQRAKEGNKTARSMLCAIAKVDPEAQKYLTALDALAVASAPQAPSKPSRHSLEKESDLQASIVAYLRSQGWMVNESLKGSRGNSTVYYTKGTPDLWILKAGRWAWIELKRPGCHPDPEQQVWHTQCRAQGGVVLVVHDFYELEVQLREAGLV